jgi:hypothetical protein
MLIIELALHLIRENYSPCATALERKEEREEKNG